eukprot:1160562-Pelagomonas_calceolata.AAC.3
MSQSDSMVVQQREANIDFNDLFSLRKPRDGWAGLSSGSKSMLKGVATGAVGLVAGPIIGAHRGGVKGCAQGLVTGGVLRYGLRARPPLAGCSLACSAPGSAALGYLVKPPCKPRSLSVKMKHFVHSN